MGEDQSDVSPSMSDEAVQSKTGKNWQEWFSILDAAGAQAMTHKEIVALLSIRHGVEPWWRQMVTVTYEKARGLRDKHETPEGFQVGRSKTIRVPVERLYAAWSDPEQRLRWLPEARVGLRTETPLKSMRLTWEEGPSILAVYFYPKGPDRCQVTINHERLSDREQAEAMKAYWGAALDRLAGYLSAA